MQYREFIRRRLILVSVLIFVLLIYAAVQFALPVAAENNGTSDEKTILIDPGHGGYDGGADSPSGVKEKDINLAISLRLRDTLKAKGFKVIMIREEDKALLNEGKRLGTKKAEDIANRCKIKDESRADVFISIHQNKFPQGKYYGSQVWYSKFKGSQELAHIVQTNLKLDLNNGNNRVEKPAKDDYRILTCTDLMPSVLVECGFLSNTEEDQLLRDEKYQQKIADSIAKSISSYLQED